MDVDDGQWQKQNGNDAEEYDRDAMDGGESEMPDVCEDESAWPHCSQYPISSRSLVALSSCRASSRLANKKRGMDSFMNGDEEGHRSSKRCVFQGVSSRSPTKTRSNRRGGLRGKDAGVDSIGGAAAGGGDEPYPVLWGIDKCSRGYAKRKLQYALQEKPRVQTDDLAERFLSGLSNACAVNDEFKKNLEVASGRESGEKTVDIGDGSSVEGLSNEEMEDRREVFALYSSIRRSERASVLSNMHWLLSHLFFFNKVQR